MSDVLDLSAIRVRPIYVDEHARWQRLMVEGHYLQSNRMVAMYLVGFDLSRSSSGR